MESFTIRLAGQYFTICPVCDYIREYCKDYIVADDAVHGIGDRATGRDTGCNCKCKSHRFSGNYGYNLSGYIHCIESYLF